MEYEYEIVRDQELRYAYCRDNGHIRYVDKARRCDEFVLGKQWDDMALAVLRAQRRPALTMNKTLPAVAAVMGEFARAQVEIGFKASDNGDPETADALNILFLYLSRRNHLPAKEADVFEDGIVTGRGFFDVRMGFEHSIRGSLEVTVPNPRNVILDPDAEAYDPAEWRDVMISKWFSHDALVNLWGKEKAEAVTRRGPTDATFGYDSVDLRPGTFGGELHRTEQYETSKYCRYRVLERQHREYRMMDHFVDIRTGDTRPILEDMPREKVQLILDQPNIELVRLRGQEIWWTITANGVLLKKSRSMYRGFTIVPYFPFFRHGATSGLVEHMLDPQEFYNKARSQELHIVNTTANSGWQGEEGQLVNMTEQELEERGAETGLVIIRKQGTAPLEKIQPNQVPTGIDRVAYVAGEDLKEISMASDSLRGFDRADVAAKAIQQKAQQGSTNFSRPLMNMSYTRRLLAENILRVVQDFYTDEKLIVISGEGPTDEPAQEVRLNEVAEDGRILRDVTVGTYDVVITDVPSRDTYGESQFQQAIQLRELGIPIPDKYLIKASHLQDKQDIIDDMEPTDGGPTPEEQQAAQMEQQIKQLEAQKLQMEIQRIQAQAMADMAKAEAEKAKAQGGAPDEQLKYEELQYRKEKDLAQLELDRYKVDRELEVRRQELLLKRQEAQQKARTDTLQLAAQLEQSRAQAQNPPEGEQTDEHS